MIGLGFELLERKRYSDKIGGSMQWICALQNESILSIIFLAFLGIT